MQLPLEIWKDRIENEIKTLRRLGALEKDSIVKHDENEESFVEMILNINALGFLKEGIDLIPVRNHRIAIRIERSFPYPGGITFSWLSPIFHPNIHPTEYISPSGEAGTGYICLNVLKKWSRLSDLETTVKALQMLIENPNPDDPLNYDICLEAADFFRENPMEKIREQFDFEEDDDDDIIIIED
ncbi:MAG: ubiquitin-conjugating enzyme E2 [Promethearchaeota archaeon]